jgi:hypothetical protein
MPPVKEIKEILYGEKPEANFAKGSASRGTPRCENDRENYEYRERLPVEFHPGKKLGF